MTVLPLRVPRLILRSAGYEMRKRIQFRTGFFVREVLFGTVEPMIMLFVYAALYASAGGGDVVLGGWSFEEILRYVAGLLVVRKLIFHNRGIELSTEIFRRACHQVPRDAAALLRAAPGPLPPVHAAAGDHRRARVGRGLRPGRGPLARAGQRSGRVAGAAARADGELLLLPALLRDQRPGVLAGCRLEPPGDELVPRELTGGGAVPVSQMPEPLQQVFGVLFPYWTITAPIELVMGRLDTADFQRGVLVLALWLLALEGLRRMVWQRGLARYVGAGM